MAIYRSDRSQGQHGGQLISTSYTMFEVATLTDVPIFDFASATGCLFQLDTFILLVVVIYFPTIGSRYLPHIDLLVNCVRTYLSLLKAFIESHTTLKKLRYLY